MTSEPDDDSLDGTPLDAAAERVASRDGTPDAETARETLARVASDGVVTQSAVDNAFGSVAMAVSNASSRVELATSEVASAREAAADAPDADRVSVRLASLADRVEELESRRDTLAADLDSLVDEKENADIYEFVRELDRVETEAEALHHEAQTLTTDAEEFAAWLSEPTRRYEGFEADLDALEDSLDDVTAAADTLEDETDTTVEAANRWFGAVCSHRAQGPVVRDLRAELVTIREWPGTDGDSDRATAAADRLDDLEARWRDLETRLDEAAEPDWQDLCGEDVASLEASLADIDPPVDFGEVGAVLEQYLPETE